MTTDSKIDSLASTVGEGFSSISLQISRLSAQIDDLAGSVAHEFIGIRKEIGELEGNVKAYVSSQLDSQTGRLLNEYDRAARRIKDLEEAKSS